MTCALKHRQPCDGPLERHHIVPKQRIKARGWELGVDLAWALNDSRNLITLCRRHHHRITHGFDRDQMATLIMQRMRQLRAFAEDYDLDSALDRELRIYKLMI